MLFADLFTDNRLQIKTRIARVLSLSLYVLLCFFISTQATAQESEDELLSINMRDAELTAVIQWVAEQTQKQIVIDPRVKGRVTVLANEPMTADQVFEVFLATLDVYGFAAVENNGILRIFPSAIANQSPSSLVENFDQIANGEQIVYVYQANNVSATRMQELLKPLIPSSGYLTAFPATNSLLIADDSNNVKRLVTMLQHIDSSGDFNIEVINLEHAAADKVADVVTSLINNENQADFSIASDQRSNSILMTGDPGSRHRVRQLIAQLDQPLAASGITRVIYLNYLDAEEVLPILQGMSQTFQENEQNNSATESTISITSSESANAIIMTAPVVILDLMADVIKQIDVRRPQVLVEAIIVEVSENFAENIGVEWNTNFANDDGIEAITNFGQRSADAEASEISLLGTGLNLGFFRNGSLRALIRALANERDANILSTPSILTLDNQEAEILVGSNVPFITGQSTGLSSSTSDPFTTIERQDIGLTLKITPQINQDDAITLDVLQEIETISESTNVANDIVTDKRSIKTKVLVENENILVLGGLISDEQQIVENKVPFLGDLPLIGTLFKSTAETIAKRNLMVFIHPVIIDSEDKSQGITERNYNTLKSLREQYSQGERNLPDAEMQDFTTYKPKNNSTEQN